MKRIIRRVFSCILTLLIVLGISSCGQKTDTTHWKEQYDLGVRYLSEGNYEEAIIAFTAAIEIDPKQAEVYIKLADAYVGMGDRENALDVLRKGIENAEEINDLQNMLDRLMTDNPIPWGLNFDDFTPDQQEYVKKLVSAVESGEREIAWDFLKKIEIMELDFVFGFTFQEYRVEMYDWGSNHDDEVGGYIEIHPENGTAFYCLFTQDTDDNFTTEYIAGSCVNWNWHGDFEHYWRYYYSDFADTVTIRNGTAINGLIDGVLQDRTIREFVGDAKAEGAKGWERTSEDIYRSGISTTNSADGFVYSPTGGRLPDDPSSDWSLPR